MTGQDRTNRFHTAAPRTGAALQSFQEASSEDIGAAAAAAVAAAPVLRALAPSDRAQLLEELADALDRDTEMLVDRADEETGLGRPRLTGEVARTSGQLRSFAAVVRDGGHLGVIIDPARERPPRPDLRRMLVPLGPVGVFGASNFPFAFGVLGGDTASALAAGCPVIAKAHPSNAGTSQLVAELVIATVAELSLPRGTYALVQGASTAVGQALVTHPEIRAIGFTGSHGGGRALYDLGAARQSPIPVYAEMGSINPMWVLPAALQRRREAIAVGLTASFTLGTGQFCTKPGVVFVPEGDDTEAFVGAVAAELADVELGPMLDERIRAAFATRSDELAQLTGVTERSVAAGPGPQGWWAGPRLFLCDLDTWQQVPQLREECFGPALVLVRVPIERIAAAALTVEGALTATIHSEPEDDHITRELSDLLVERVGRLIHNGYPTGVAVTWAMHHGGPYPATTSPLHTSVGATAIERFLRPISYQDAPAALLPPAVRDDNPWRLPRRVDGELQVP